MKCPRAIEGPFNFPTEINWRDDHTCSYCGCLNPKEFFRLIEDGAEVGPTDKSYKAYIKHEDAPRGMGKVYFQHFSEDDKCLFVELVNNKTMKIGMPGHFYSMPFFMTADKTNETRV